MLRRVHPVVHMFLLLFFLEVVGLVNLTRYEAQSTVVRSHVLLHRPK